MVKWKVCFGGLSDGKVTHPQSFGAEEKHCFVWKGNGACVQDVESTWEQGGGQAF